MPVFDVVSIGGATQDVFVRTDLSRIVTTRDLMSSSSVLAFDYPSKVNVDDIAFQSGGGATNTAVSFARLGLSSACYCAVGNDDAGAAVLAELRREGVDTSLVVRPADLKTGYSVVLNSFEGDRTVLAYRGANSSVGPDSIPWEALRRARWLYISSLTGSSGEILDDIAFFSEEHGVSLALNPGATQIKMGLRGLAKILSVVEILFLNKDEATQLTGIQWSRRVAIEKLCNLCGACVDVCPVTLFRIADGKLYIGDERRCLRCGECLSICPPRAILMEPWAGNLDPIFHAIRELGPKLVVITDGRNGAQAYDGRMRYIVPPCDVSVADTLGAGDGFGAAFTAAQALGEDIETSLLWAVANSGSIVQKTGAKPGILRREEVEPFLTAHHPGRDAIRKGEVSAEEVSAVAE